MLSLLWKELRARRWATIGWGLGLGLYAYGIMLLFPQMAEQFGNMELPEIYSFFGNYSNFTAIEGWIPNQFLDWLPLLLGILAIVAGTGTLGGEEDEGTLELLLALPLKRWQLVLVKTAALGIVMLIILLACFLGLWAGFAAIQGQLETTVTASNIFWATLNAWPFLMLLTTFSIFLGTYLPHRRHAAIAATLFLVATYLINNLGNVSEQIEPLQPYLPFHYYASADVMTGKLEQANPLLLAAAAVLFLGLALLSFQRRNVTVGAWPWQRARV